MQLFSILVQCLLICSAASDTGVRREPLEENTRPIIGILSQEIVTSTLGIAEGYTSYIAASFVKQVESSGARVVPIMIGRNRSYYEELVNKINGVVLPGGEAPLNSPGGYADAGQYMYELAQNLNDQGHYFPIYGSCLGFELLIILASGRGQKENRDKCYSFDNSALNFTKDFRSSKMFSDAPQHVIDILSKENVTVNAHSYCVMDDNLRAYNLTEDWRVTSHSNDLHGVEFISSIEHTRYPFYGVQFHPEKSSFEWKASRFYTHTMNAVVANRYFMDFFVTECRKSNHTFSDSRDEQLSLIYNYSPLYTGLNGSIFEECYLFEPKGIVSS